MHTFWAASVVPSAASRLRPFGCYTELRTCSISDHKVLDEIAFLYADLDQASAGTVTGKRS